MPKLKGLLHVVLAGWLWAAGVAAEPQRVTRLQPSLLVGQRGSFLSGHSAKRRQETL